MLRASTASSNGTSPGKGVVRWVEIVEVSPHGSPIVGDGAERHLNATSCLAGGGAAARQVSVTVEPPAGGGRIVGVAQLREMSMSTVERTDQAHRLA
jgi:hypothetical protein